MEVAGACLEYVIRLTLTLPQAKDDWSPHCLRTWETKDVRPHRTGVNPYRGAARRALFILCPRRRRALGAACGAAKHCKLPRVLDQTGSFSGSPRALGDRPRRRNPRKEGCASEHVGLAGGAKLARKTRGRATLRSEHRARKTDG